MATFTVDRDTVLIALNALETEQKSIQDRINKLRSLIGAGGADFEDGETPKRKSRPPKASSNGTGKPRRKMSEAGRLRIAEGQRRRWQEKNSRGEETPAEPLSAATEEVVEAPVEVAAVAEPVEATKTRGKKKNA